MVIALASRSPRRRELLDQIGVAYRVLDVTVDESRRAGESPRRYVRRVAADKALAGRAALGAGEPLAVLAADTVVVLGDDVLGKPADAGEARRMLDRLSGRVHHVISGVALAAGGAVHRRLSVSAVRLRPIAPAERDAYCDTGEPLDKAGGYAIQGRAAVFVRELHGSYSGVMGLPLYETAELLAAYAGPG